MLVGIYYYYYYYFSFKLQYTAKSSCVFSYTFTIVKHFLYFGETKITIKLFSFTIASASIKFKDKKQNFESLEMKEELL